MLNMKNIELLILDFDGVLTDNRVIVGENGDESVICSRSDGLAFDALRALNIPTLVLSTEKNRVVSARARKIGAKVISGQYNKATALLAFQKENGINLSQACYLGNDINDIAAMKLCGYRFSPCDGHPLVKSICTEVLTTRGGYGVVRELVESVFKVDILSLLFPSKGLK
jgi:3-deoxy-D-manno-octulosonate 8-phosphate phosphatase (KDO 8-P phosphatase)